MMSPIFTSKISDDELFTTLIISQLIVSRLLSNLLEYLRPITAGWLGGGWDTADLQGAPTLSHDP